MRHAMWVVPHLIVFAAAAVAARVPPTRPHETHKHRAQQHANHTAKETKSEAASGPAAAKAPPSPQVGNVERIESVESIEPIESVEPQSTGPQGATPNAADDATVPAAIRLAGHLHAASVHLPIAYVLLWAGILVAGPALGKVSLMALARPLPWISLCSFAPAVSSGLARLTELGAGQGYEQAPALLHRNLMFASLAVLVVGIALTELHHRWPRRALGRLTAAVALLCALMVGYSAHLGGQLVYGDDFLPF